MAVTKIVGPAGTEYEIEQSGPRTFVTTSASVRLDPALLSRPQRFDHAYDAGSYGVCRRCGHERH